MDKAMIIHKNKHQKTDIKKENKLNTQYILSLSFFFVTETNEVAHVKYLA